MAENARINPDKNEVITVDGVDYSRVALKTHVISDKDNLLDVVNSYAKPNIQPGDILVISEKIVACTQKRAIPIKDVKPRRLATFLSKHVVKTNYGIGLGMPETMEMALRECGTIRILFAAGVSVIGKLFGKSGWFYVIAGEKARAIDGPCDYTLPPYNEYVVLGPLEPDKVAQQVADELGCGAVVIDANDIGVNTLGVSQGIDGELVARIFSDNPLGQTDEQTPMGIIRKKNS